MVPEDAEMGTEELHYRVNPLLIPHVVQSIFSYTKFSDLKNARLVCTLWRDCASEGFREKRTLRLKDFKHIDAFMTQEAEEDWFPAKDLCQNVSLNGPDFQAWIILLKPFFAKYGNHIKAISISHGLGDVTEDLLLQIAQHIEALEELTISGTTVVYSERYLEFDRGIDGGGFQFQPYLPTVKKINLSLPVTCFKRWSDARTFFTDFFSIFPNLESIKFVGCQFPELFKYLPETIQFPKLRDLHMQLINSSGLDLFMNRKFPLRSLVLEVEPLLGLDHLHNFLTSISQTLEHLELRFNYKGAYNYSHNATAFPSSKSLKKLKDLKVFGYWGHLYFLQDFPALKRATVERINWSVAFPQGAYELGDLRKILKFFDEDGAFIEL